METTSNIVLHAAQINTHVYYWSLPIKKYFAPILKRGVFQSTKCTQIYGGQDISLDLFKMELNQYLLIPYNLYKTIIKVNYFSHLDVYFKNLETGFCKLQFEAFDFMWAALICQLGYIICYQILQYFIPWNQWNFPLIE